MADVLESGRPEGSSSGSRARRTAAGVVLVLGVGAALLYQARFSGGSAGDASRSGGSPSAAASVPPSARPPWPTAPGLCGGDDQVAVFEAVALTEHTGMTAVVGGNGLRRVAVDSGTVTAYPNAGIGGGVVQDLSVSRGTLTALVGACGAPNRSRLVRVPADRSPATTPGAADGLLPGAGGEWAVDYPADGAGPVVLRGLGRSAGRVLRLPAWTSPVGLTRYGLVASVDPRDGGDPARVTPARVTPATVPARIVALGLGTLRPIRTLGLGWPVAVSSDTVIYSPGGCAMSARCTLLRTDLRTGHPLPPIVLPAGREPLSGGVFSPDGTRLAVLLRRPAAELRYDPGHPGGAASVGILDLRSGELRRVPCLVLPAKTTPGLTFSADGHHLVMAVSEAGHTTLLVWRPGLSRAQRSPAALPGRPSSWLPLRLVG